MSRRRNVAQEDETSVKNIQKKIRMENRRKRRNRIKRIARRVLTLTLIASLIFAVYAFDKSKYSRIREIEIKGNEAISDAVILENLKIKKNDRIIKGLFYKLTGQDIGNGVANSSIKLYYTKGLLSLTVEEYPVVATLRGEKGNKYLFSDNYLGKADNEIYSSAPILTNFDEKLLTEHPKFSEKLSKIKTSTFNSISEITVVDEPLEDIYFKITMNNGYFVFTNLTNLLLMDYYPDIVSGIQQGDKKDNRCIYFLDYGHTDENQSAIARPCSAD